MAPWEDYLKALYYDPKQPASFAGPQKLYKIVQQEGKYKIGMHKIRKFLNNQEAYSLHKPVRRRFLRNHVISGGIDDLWMADLMDMVKYTEWNDGYKYILLVIDTFSKYIWLRPLKRRTGEDVANAFSDIMKVSRRTPKKLMTDKDFEYNQLIMKQVFVTVSLVLTLIVFLAQVVRSRHEDKKYHRLITRSAILVTLPLGLMISIICQDLVYTDYMIDTRSYDEDRDHTYIGFPYSIALYIGAVFFQSLASLLLMNQSAGPGKEKPKAKKSPDSDSDNYGGRPIVKAEFVPVHDNFTSDSCKTTKEVEPISSICYSEKL